MRHDAQREVIIEKMFNAALKGKFEQLARKYDRGLVFEGWTHAVTIQTMRTYLGRWGWDSQMTIAQALDHLDEFINFIEDIIKEYQGLKNRPSKIINTRNFIKEDFYPVQKS